MKRSLIATALALALGVPGPVLAASGGPVVGSESGVTPAPGPGGFGTGSAVPKPSTVPEMPLPGSGANKPGSESTLVPPDPSGKPAPLKGRTVSPACPTGINCPATPGPALPAGSTAMPSVPTPTASRAQAPLAP